MQLPSIISETLGWLAYHFVHIQPFIPTYTHLLLSALFPIVAGAHASLSRPSTAAKPIKSLNKDGTETDEENDEPLRMEGLSPTDALLFPVLAGSTLATLYFLLKWLQDPTLLNKILNWYFATFSVFSVSRLVSDALDVFHSLLFPHDYLDRGILFHVDPKLKQAFSTDPSVKETRSSPLPWIFSRLPLPRFVVDFFWMLHVLPNRKLSFKAFAKGIGSFKLGLGIHGLEGFTIGLASVLYYNFVSKPWWLTNLMGFGFAYGSLQIMSPTTFWTGTLILSGLFFYDIYFVFFTPMMVTVAKSLDIPIKLLFPRPPEPGADPAARALSMLGLGDVVLPGIMIGLALRFDLHMFYLRKQTKTAQAPENSSNSRKPSKIETNPTNVSKTGDQSPTIDATISKEPDTKTSSALTSAVSKAPYTSVAEGWGDRLWTTSFFSSPAKAYTPRGVFPKPYFRASIIGYVVGMLATLGAMQLSNHAQPALLYLVPAVLTSLWGTAYIRGEFQDFWTFSDALEDEPNAKNDKDTTSKQNTEKIKEGSKAADKKETGMSSFFGFKRSEERSQRVEKSITKYYTEEADIDNSKSKTAKGEKDSQHRGRDHSDGSTLFSFSIIAPPPLFPESKVKEEAEPKDLNLTGTRARSDAMSQGSIDDDPTTEGHNSGVETGDGVPRWSSGRGSDATEEHTGKRQRLD